MAKEKSLIYHLHFHFNWKHAIIVALCFSVLVKLGFWQLNRAEQKRQHHAQYLQSTNATPIAIENLEIQSLETINHQQVYLTGHYINDKSIYISNKFYRGRPGFEVFTPFKLRSNAQIVLISRGFIAMPYQQNHLPAVSVLYKEQKLLGSIHLPAKNSFFLKEKTQDNKWPLRLHHFHNETIAEQLKSSVAPYIVRLSADNKSALEAFWPIKKSNSEQSTAYAIQWFIMAFLLLLISSVRSTNIIQLLKSKQ